MNTSMTQRWNRRSIAMAGLVLSFGVLLVCHYLRTSASTASESTLRDSSTTRASLQPSSDIPDMIPADFQPEVQLSPTEIELVPIEQIKVGMRVPALNPEVTAEERATFKDPDPASWQLMELEHEKPDGGVLLISMLRPIEWIHQQGIHSGGSFQIDMPELGAKGLAKVLALKPCPEIQAGPGHVVLSTFAHPATHEILDVTIGEGEDAETIGVTETHPFWSVQDQAFVPVGHLVAGSQVLTADEQTKTITSILPRPGPVQQVYNLEVNGEHVYYVGQQQLLVHNNGCVSIKLGNNMAGGAWAGDAMRHLGYDAHHIVPWNLERAGFIRDFMVRNGFSMDEIKYGEFNGVWLPGGTRAGGKGRGIRNSYPPEVWHKRAPTYASKHSNDTMNEIFTRLQSLDGDKDAIMSEIIQIGWEMQSGLFRNQ